MTRETVAAAPIDVHTTTADSNTCASREAATAIIAPSAVSVKCAQPSRGHLSKFNSTRATTKNCYNSYDRDRTRSTTLLKSIRTTKQSGDDSIVLH